jgi:hypothetical protein
LRDASVGWISFCFTFDYCYCGLERL